MKRINYLIATLLCLSVFGSCSKDLDKELDTKDLSDINNKIDMDDVSDIDDEGFEWIDWSGISDYEFYYSPEVKGCTGKYYKKEKYIEGYKGYINSEGGEINIIYEPEFMKCIGSIEGINVKFQIDDDDSYMSYRFSLVDWKSYSNEKFQYMTENDFIWYDRNNTDIKNQPCTWNWGNAFMSFHSDDLTAVLTIKISANKSNSPRILKLCINSYFDCTITQYDSKNDFRLSPNDN